MATQTTTSPTSIPDVMAWIEETTGEGRNLFATRILVEFFEGDHRAALFFNQILYLWLHEADVDGWFYKTHAYWHDKLRLSEFQVRRIIQGDPRVQSSKRTLWSIGLETIVKMAPNGRNATHYRLNIPAFMTAFLDWFEDYRPAPTAKSPFEHGIQRWGRPTERIQEKLEQQQARLGDDPFNKVLERCFQHDARSWQYAIKALTQEPTPKRDHTNYQWALTPLSSTTELHESMVMEHPQEAHVDCADDIPVCASMEQQWTPIQSRPNDTTSVADLWAQVEGDLSRKFGATFQQHFGDLHLVKFDQQMLTFTFVTDSSAWDHVSQGGRVEMQLKQHLRSVFGFEPSAAVYIHWHTRSEWRQQFTE